MPFHAGAIIGKAHLDTSSWESGLRSIGKATGVALAAIATAATVAMTKAVQASDEFAKAMSNIDSIVDESTVNMQEMARTLLTLNPELGNTTEVAQGMYQAFSAGATTAEEAFDITTNAAKFAKAGLTDTFTAVDVLTTAINAYGKENLTAEKASDLLFNTVKYGKVTGEELAASLGSSIPLFASVGISMEELTAGMSSMTKVGVNAHHATTELNSIVNAFIKPSDAMTEALKKSGYESGSALLKAEGLSGALAFLQTHTEGSADALGELVPNIRGMKGVMALARDGGAEFNMVLEEQKNALGVTQKAFEEQDKTFDTFKNSMAQVQIIVGNIGLHFVHKIARGATTAAMAVRDFLLSGRGMEIIAQVISNVAGAFELFKIILSSLIQSIFTPVKEAISNIANTMKGMFDKTDASNIALKILAGALKISAIAAKILIKIIEMNITAQINFVKVIIDTAEAIGTLAKIMSKEVTWADVKSRFKDIGESAKNMVMTYVGSAKELVGDVVEEFKDFGTEVTASANVIKAAVVEKQNAVHDYITSNWSELTTGRQDFNADMTDSLGAMTDEVVSANDVIVEDTKKSLFNLEATWEDYYDNISSGIESMLSDIGSLSQEKNEKIISDLEIEAEKEQAILDQKLANKEITEQQYAASTEALRVANLVKLNAAKKKAFDSNKKFMIADTIMTGANAIMGWWAAASKLGPIAGPIFGAIMTAATGALTGVQIAMIAKQQFVPGKKQGGMASGLTRINEDGGELVVLPDKSVVVPNDLSRQIVGGRSNEGNVINVSFKGAVINDDISLNKIVDQVSRKLARELRSA